MPKVLWSSVVACALLAGCAALYPRTEPVSKQRECDSGDACVIAVNVACTRFYGCELSVDYDLALVKGRGKSTNIVWRLTGDPSRAFRATVSCSTSANSSAAPSRKLRSSPAPTSTPISAYSNTGST